MLRGAPRQNMSIVMAERPLQQWNCSGDLPQIVVAKRVNFKYVVHDYATTQTGRLAMESGSGALQVVDHSVSTALKSAVCQRQRSCGAISPMLASAKHIHHNMRRLRVRQQP
jgi:hypothetical protein